MKTEAEIREEIRRIEEEARQESRIEVLSLYGHRKWALKWVLEEE